MLTLAACGSVPKGGGGSRARDCMARVMYFESNRSSDDGMLAVGTVVMNRVGSGKYPNSVCGVVGQSRQFAPGVLSKPMQEGKSRERAYRNADAVLGGKRHRGVGKRAMFFHTAGYNYPYTNMHYQVIAGGNAFYEKRTTKGGLRNTTQTEVAGLIPRERPIGVAQPVQLAQVEMPRVPKTRRRQTAPAIAPPPPIFVPDSSEAAGPEAASIEELILAQGY